jgi:hypothetical protein
MENTKEKCEMIWKIETRAIPFLLSSIWGQLKSHLRRSDEELFNLHCLCIFLIY